MNELPDNAGDEARRWLANVEDDLRALHAVERDPAAPARIVCFLAHLAVEKALKATLIDAAVPFAKTHDLVALYDRCHDAGRLAGVERSTLALLSPWGVDGRYADDLHDADRSLGAQFTAFADHLVALVRAEVTEPKS